MTIPQLFFRTSLTGGGDFALDGIDGNRLSNGDACHVSTLLGGLYDYWLNASSGAAESSPDVISPDTNAGNKRWILCTPSGLASILSTTITDGDTTHAPNGNSVFDALALKAPLLSPALITPALGTPTAGVLTACSVATAADNTTTTAIASTAFTKAQDAVLRRAPDQAVWLVDQSASPIAVANNANILFTTTNMTLVWEGYIPDYTKTGSIYLITKTGANTSGYLLLITATGLVRVGVRAGSDLYYDSTVAISTVVPDGAYCSIIVCITRETATVNGSVTIHVNGVQLGDAIAITAVNPPVTISDTDPLYIGGYSGHTDTQAPGFVAIYNRALTAAQVLSLYRNGIDFGDKWGNQTATYTSNFSAGVDGWTIAAGCSIDGNIDSIGGYNDVLRCTSDGSTGQHAMYVDGWLVVRKNYSVTYEYYIPSANTTIKRIVLTGQSSDSTAFTFGSVLDAWTTQTIILNRTVTYFQFSGQIVSGDYTASFTGTNGDVFYVKNIVVKPAGIVIALEPEGIQPSPGQWLDSSTNKLHAMQPATGSSLVRKLDTFRINWTNTWAATHELQYIGGVNQAILPANCYIDSIIGVIAGATIEDVIVGDGSDTDRWVAITTGLAAGTKTFTIANNNSDGTNKKMTVDPDANFTGSITWTITGRILS